MIGKVNARYFGFCIMQGDVKTGPESGRMDETSGTSEN